jgi:hypothetical protein
MLTRRSSPLYSPLRWGLRDQSIAEFYQLPGEAVTRHPDTWSSSITQQTPCTPLSTVRGLDSGTLQSRGSSAPEPTLHRLLSLPKQVTP